MDAPDALEDTQLAGLREHRDARARGHHDRRDCPGTVSKPEADPGFLCVYSETLEDPLSEPGTVRTSGVVLVFNSTSTSPKTDEGTWAITAP